MNEGLITRLCCKMDRVTQKGYTSQVNPCGKQCQHWSALICIEGRANLRIQACHQRQFLCRTTDLVSPELTYKMSKNDTGAGARLVKRTLKVAETARQMAHSEVTADPSARQNQGMLSRLKMQE